MYFYSIYTFCKYAKTREIIEIPEGIEKTVKRTVKRTVKQGCKPQVNVKNGVPCINRKGINVQAVKNHNLIYGNGLE